MSFFRPLTRGLRKAALPMLGAVALAGCGTSPMSTVDPAGTHAQNIFDLLIPVAWAALAVFIVVEGILLYSVWRFRRRGEATMPVQVHGNTRIEVMWTIAPALIVLVIAVLTFRTQAINSTLPPDALKVTARGWQWWFEFEYPQQGIVTASDLVIPVGRDVTVQLEAKDVMHNFWIPRLAGKTYMIPTKENYINFKPLEAGVYRAQCAEFCGEAHALMKFRVIALPQEEYERWVAAQRTVPVPPAGQEQPPAAGQPPQTPQQLFPNDLAAQGQLVFTRKGCIGCHAINGNNRAKGNQGPNLTYFGSRYTIAAGVLDNTDENLARWLRNPNEVKPGNKMGAAIQAGTLTEDEISALVAYLQSMKLPDMQMPANPDPIQ